MPIIPYTAGFKPFLQIVIGDAFSQNKKAFRHAGRQMNHNLLDRFQFCFNFSSSMLKIRRKSDRLAKLVKIFIYHKARSVC